MKSPIESDLRYRLISSGLDFGTFSTYFKFEISGLQGETHCQYIRYHFEIASHFERQVYCIVFECIEFETLFDFLTSQVCY